MPLSPTTCARIDDIVRERQAAGRAPALIAGVIRDGELAHTAAAGHVCRDAAEPDIADIQSRIGSISKTFTAALVLGLHAEGRLDLDEPVAAHLPGLAVATPTPRQLLAHVSGLRREPDGPWWERNPGVDIPALIAAIDSDAAVHPPSTTYHYSNLGYGLLGAVVTAITGDTFADALATRIGKPLGLHRTTYQPVEPFLRGYVVHPHTDLKREEPREDSRAMAPAGQLWSTVADLGRWAAFLADPSGAPRVLAAAEVDEMFRPAVIDDPESWGTGHSLGLQMWRVGNRVYAGHTGSMPGYLAVLMVHRATRTAVVAFANAYSLGRLSLVALGSDLLTAVVEAEPAATRPWRAAVAEPPADVVPLLGPWWWMGSQFDLTWDADAAEVVIGGAGYPKTAQAWRFAPTAPDVWRCRTGMNNGETMYVRRDAAGAPVELDIATFVFTRDPWPAEVR